jgi:hypothetical protein
MNKRYTGMAGELETLTESIKGALEGIGLVRPLISIILANEIGSEHSKRSLSPTVQISASFWDDDMVLPEAPKDLLIEE